MEISMAMGMAEANLSEPTKIERIYIEKNE
jgi:hypothetical protein